MEIDANLFWLTKVFSMVITGVHFDLNTRKMTLGNLRKTGCNGRDGMEKVCARIAENERRLELINRWNKHVSSLLRRSIS